MKSHYDLQSVAEIDAMYAEFDPWSYETNPYDHSRKAILLSHINRSNPKRTLDIGCGHGFLTRDLPGGEVIGIDISSAATTQAQATASPRHHYKKASVFDVAPHSFGAFDLIVITGVLYQHYIGNTLPLVYMLIDSVLNPGGVLVSAHIDEWYRGRFPYRLLTAEIYRYREYLHRLEVYMK